MSAAAYTHRHSIRVSEYVFVCLLEDTVLNDIVPLYVSKEYNVCGDESYAAGRFVFVKPAPVGLPSHRYHYMLLAEESATAYTRSDFNVEQYYLEIRKYRQPGKVWWYIFIRLIFVHTCIKMFSLLPTAATSSGLDPVCKLTSRDLSANQSSRLCVEILSSAHFEDRIEYPKPLISFTCYELEVSFRTEEGMRRAAGNSYREFMIRCESTLRNSHAEKISIFISRAYRRNQVFVYSPDSDGAERGVEKVHLENLSINVAVVDEPIHIEDVE
jgi:hypothetical protein